MRVDPFLQAHRGSVVLVAAVLPVLACALLTLARDAVTSATAVLILVVLIVAAAATGLRAAALLSALTAALAFDWFLAPPYFTFTIADPHNLEAAALLLLVGAAVGEIALWGRRQAARASRDQGYLDGVISAAASAARSSSASLVEQVGAQIADVLRVDRVRFDPATRYGGPTVGDDGRIASGGRPLDVARLGLPTNSTIALPVVGGGRVRGHYLLTASSRVSRPTATQLRVAVLLAQQAGAGLTADALAHDAAGPPDGGGKDSIPATVSTDRSARLPAGGCQADTVKVRRTGTGG